MYSRQLWWEILPALMNLQRNRSRIWNDLIYKMYKQEALNMPTKKATPVAVFLSSTYNDLKIYRDAVEGSIRHLGNAVIGMDYFGSDSKKPLDWCLEKVRESSLFICIIGHVYGSIDEGTGLSFTHLEYREAMKNNIPVLAYVLSPKVNVPLEFIEKGEGWSKLEDFKKELQNNHTIGFFSSAIELSTHTTRDIIKEVKKLKDVNVDKEKLNSIANALESAAGINKEGIELYQAFMRRPKKFANRQVRLTIKIKRAPHGTDSYDFIRQLGLEFGDTLGASIAILDENMSEVTSNYLYAHGAEADILETCAIDQVLNIIAIPKLATVTRIHYPNGGGVVQTFDSFKNLVLKEVVV